MVFQNDLLFVNMKNRQKKIIKVDVDKEKG